ncbi:MAG: shikimate dehydrogenase, partial [Lentisphaeria bacterium]|nr:shikimate dehydrogenase [Lentisphaeria bacterium]
MTLRFGLIGFPVKHSVSPQMQMAGFKAMDIDASYELVEIDPANLKEGIQMLSDSFCGWNITVPHKLAMIDLVDEIDPAAEIAGSINTVLNENGRLRAWSTDGYGLEMAIFDSFKIAV